MSEFRAVVKIIRYKCSGGFGRVIDGEAKPVESATMEMEGSIFVCTIGSFKKGYGEKKKTHVHMNIEFSQHQETSFNYENETIQISDEKCTEASKLHYGVCDFDMCDYPLDGTLYTLPDSKVTLKKKTFKQNNKNKSKKQNQKKKKNKKQRKLNKQTFKQNITKTNQNVKTKT